MQWTRVIGATERFSDFYDHFLFKVLVQNHDIRNISEINADILKKS